MRRFGWVGLLVGLTVVVAGGCGTRQAGGGTPGAATSGGTDKPVAQPVPWLDKVAPSYVPPPYTPPANPGPLYADCTATQLSGKDRGSYAGAGNVWTTFVLTNTSATPCTLAHAPSSAIGVGVDSTTRRLGTGPMNGYQGDLSPANLNPGQSAQAFTDSIDGTGFCDTNTYTLHTLAIGIGNTGSVVITFPDGKPLTLYTCGTRVPQVDGFGVPAPDSPPPPLAALTVTRSMPAMVTEGTTADYTVTLTNPTSNDIALSPCPSYGEFMGLPGQVRSANPRLGGSTYYLNCQAAPAIPARSSVTFDMEIQVPRGTGTAKYAWEMQGGGPATGGITTVTATSS